MGGTGCRRVAARAHAPWLDQARAGPRFGSGTSHVLSRTQGWCQNGQRLPSLRFCGKDHDGMIPVRGRLDPELAGTAPFEWTYAHHIDPFGPPTRGETDLDNLIPVCGRCHDLVHRPGWRVAKDPDGPVHTWAPDGTHWRHHPTARERRRAQPQPAAAPDPEPEEMFAGV